MAGDYLIGERKTEEILEIQKNEDAVLALQRQK